jgi:hypothetical protein
VTTHHARRNPARHAGHADRDDKRKENPSLIAYKQLSESEKDYDRETVKETIKAALLLGYDVVKVD